MVNHCSKLLLSHEKYKKGEGLDDHCSELLLSDEIFHKQLEFRCHPLHSFFISRLISSSSSFFSLCNFGIFDQLILHLNGVFVISQVIIQVF